MTGEGLSGDLETGDHGCQDDGCRTLHVVIEDAMAPGILHQNPTGVGGPEVLEVQQGVRVQLAGDLEVLVDEFVIALPAHSGMTIAEVRRVVEQVCVVGADVEVDGDGALRTDARGCRVESELAYRDVGPVDSPVPNSEYLLGVGDNEEVDVVRSQLEGLEGGADILDVVDGQVDRAGASVGVTPLLDGLADGGVVDHRQQLDEVIDQQLVVKGLVTVLEFFQEDVTVNVAVESLELAVAALGLLLESLDGCRKPSDHPVLQPFGAGESRSPIRDRVRHGFGFPGHDNLPVVTSSLTLPGGSVSFLTSDANSSVGRGVEGHGVDAGVAIRAGEVEGDALDLVGNGLSQPVLDALA